MPSSSTRWAVLAQWYMVIELFHFARATTEAQPPPTQVIMENDYLPGGIHAGMVTAVIEQCSCDRGHAVAALQTFRNNVEHAVNSINSSRRRPRPNTAIPRMVVDSGSIVQERNPRKSQAAPPAGVRHYQPYHRRISPGAKSPEVVSSRVPIRTGREEFDLPKLAFSDPESPFDLREGRNKPFSVERLTCAVQHGLSLEDLRTYLSYFSNDANNKPLHSYVCGIRSIFFAVETGNTSIVCTWVDGGGDVNARFPDTGAPLLAFAIVRRTSNRDDTVQMVRTLLSLGADVAPIPTHLYNLHNEGTDEAANSSASAENTLPQQADQSWCNGSFQKKLTESLTITHRYLLKRSARCQVPSSRRIQVGNEHNIISLLGLPYSIIGQDTGIDILIDRVFTHFATSAHKPLVLTFAGPSGHGKTELGRRLGDLLSLQVVVIDMTQIGYESDLFGTRAPFAGSETGSTLNNFLSDKSGQRAVVLLDEIEKVAPTIMNGLLTVFDEGVYQDRRSGQRVDCQDIIWILATNALDAEISLFCDSRPESRDIAGKLEPRLKEELASRLFTTMKAKFGFPLSGRVSTIIPFLLFTKEEQIVLVHKYLIELKSRLRRPVTLQSKQLVGNIELHIVDEVAVCRSLSDNYYDQDRGARSLAAAVENELGTKVVGKYLETNRSIEGNQPVEKYILDIDSEGYFTVSHWNDD